jgi:hypothetical protein
MLAHINAAAFSRARCADHGAIDEANCRLTIASKKKYDFACF